jgi:hypothetical protein
MYVNLITKFDELALAPTINPVTREYDGEYWVTLARTMVDVDGILIDILPGFVTNLGSVPKIGRCFVDISDESMLGFIVHDYLYCKRTIDCTRKFADLALLLIAKAMRQDWTERHLAYWCVRIGGYFKFKKSRALFIDVPHSLIDKICYDNGYFPDSQNVFREINNRVREKYEQMTQEGTSHVGD